MSLGPIQCVAFIGSIFRSQNVCFLFSFPIADIRLSQNCLTSPVHTKTTGLTWFDLFKETEFLQLFRSLTIPSDWMRH